MRVTIKGQVTIPKDIRDHLGIGPGSAVEFVRQGAHVHLVAVAGTLTADERTRKFREALTRMAGTVNTMGMDGKAYVDWLRGPREDLDLD
ncbi:MAG: AbrB/MazE/SpoVT family DNA-binding domain-containing protein [Rhizobiaceae bacterium]|nr:AbrB/MazE/SpoVT family DNA-binding domain-containing protein [Rhizobiaceae bacterium]